MPVPLEPTDDDRARIAVAEQFRRLGHVMAGGQHDPQVLAALAERLGAEADELQGAPIRRREAGRFTTDGMQIPLPAEGEHFPNSVDRPVSGHGNPFSVPLSVWREGDRAVTEVTIEPGFEGAPGMCHGGYVAAIYDDLLGFLLMLQQTIAFTASLTINYVEGTPMATPLRFASWIERVEGKKLYLAGECHAGDRLLTTCEGLFIDVRERFMNAASS